MNKSKHENRMSVKKLKPKAYLFLMGQPDNSSSCLGIRGARSVEVRLTGEIVSVVPIVFAKGVDLVFLVEFALVALQDEFIKSSVDDLVPIPSESEDTSWSDSECILPSCDDFSPINVFKEKSVTFSNLLFNLNDDFTYSDDESLSDEEVLKDNVKIYSNPLFEFDDEYISSDVNPFFDEVLEDIDCKDSYDFNLDESTFLDEYFTPGDDVELLLHRDPSTPIMSVVSILTGFTDEPPLEENDDMFDLEPKNDD
nr:hypothetical protein [Tanacetum cinerariifolium]